VSAVDGLRCTRLADVAPYTSAFSSSVCVCHSNLLRLTALEGWVWHAIPMYLYFCHMNKYLFKHDEIVYGSDFLPWGIFEAEINQLYSGPNLEKNASEGVIKVKMSKQVFAIMAYAT